MREEREIDRLYNNGNNMHILYIIHIYIYYYIYIHHMNMNAFIIN